MAAQVANFKVVNKLGQPNVPGEGHIHFFLDVDAPTTPGQPAVTAPGTYVATTETSYTWKNLPPGIHKFSVELVNNDHTPLVPPVAYAVEVNVVPPVSLSPPPAIAFTSPKDDAVVTAGNVTVNVQVANFTLVDKLGQPNVAGEGHIHFFLDVTAPTTQGQPAVTAAGTYAATASTSYTWTGVTAGKHTFSAELINNNHTPLNPPVVATMTITVQPAPAATATATPTATSPTVTITAPANGSTLSAGDILVTVQTVNFKLIDKLGQANVAGEGHIHYFLDVTAPTIPGQPAVTASGTYAATANTSYTWTAVSSGSHTFSVELVNNDHTPLVPPVVAKVTVTVSSGSQAGMTATIDLVAQNTTFDKATITVPAGAFVTINFNNKDTAIPHNFAVYDSAQATRQIFKGSFVSGPGTTVYSFIAPTTPGTYFFRCDAHPSIMTGSFIVQ